MPETKIPRNDGTVALRTEEVIKYLEAHGVKPLPEEDPEIARIREEKRLARLNEMREREEETRERNANTPHDPKDDCREINIADLNNQIRMQKEADDRAGETQRIETDSGFKNFVRKILG